MKKLKISVLIMSLLLLTSALCGCGVESGGGKPNSDTGSTSKVPDSLTKTPDKPAGTEGASSTPVPTNSEGESSMKKYQDMTVELAPKEILQKREGVSYPEFQKYTYYSKTAERDTNVNVLLPAGYDESKKYPVLYILHGYWDNETWMARDVVHLSTMLTNLVADGDAKEFIVVCPYIFCNKDMPYCTNMDSQNTLSYDNFINDLMTDLMPFIEENFSVAAGRENTAITGFSMGGRESLYIGTVHAEIFGYIGAVCPAPGLVKSTGSPYNLEDSELKFENDKPYLLMISASRTDGVVGSNPSYYDKLLTKNGAEHIFHQMSSTGHDHTSVIPHLYNFFRMVFR